MAGGSGRAVWGGAIVCSPLVSEQQLLWGRDLQAERVQSGYDVKQMCLARTGSATCRRFCITKYGS